MTRWDVIIENLKNRPHDKIAEIGVLRGVMTKHILEALPDIKLYVCVDPWAKHQPYIDCIAPHVDKIPDFNASYVAFQRNVKPYNDKIYELRKLSEVAYNMFPDDFFDFVFIDANHTHQSVKNDISYWMPKVNATGVLAGHDYGTKFPGVKKAVDALVNVEIKDSGIWWYEAYERNIERM
jgi:predicted O-methyltransferase YrrM